MSFERGEFERSSLELAPFVLGGIFSHDGVSIRVTEVEAYIGDGADPGSHAFRGRTRRNASMYGEPGHLYAYFTYGMHTCANMVCSPAGVASGLLLRGGEVVDGLDLARRRRTTSRSDHDLARGPARLTIALGITLADDGADLNAPPFDFTFPDKQVDYVTGPRTGVSGPGGGPEFPWRFWIPGEPSVSPYRKSTPKRSTTTL